MGRFLLQGLRWTGLGALFGVGSSLISGNGSITGGISSVLSTIILCVLGFLFIYIIFKLYKK